MQLTSFRLPYPIVELGQSSGMAVGVAGQSGEIAGLVIETLELQPHGGVVATFSNGDKWVFTATGYGRAVRPAAKGKAA